MMENVTEKVNCCVCCKCKEFNITSYFFNDGRVEFCDEEKKVVLSGQYAMTKGSDNIYIIAYNQMYACHITEDKLLSLRRII